MIVATVDLETDPFEYGKVPEPFALGFWDGEEYLEIWHKDCVKRFVDWLKKTTKGPYLIYAHNGGKFDYHYFMKYFEGEMRIVNSRVIQSHIGPHQFRDSYSILPFPLSKYDKVKIDIEKMRRETREKNRQEISTYLKRDCTSLRELVVAFHEEFGDKLTVGSAALKQLKDRHKFKCGGPAFDEKFRENFYFGGRVQVFKSGIVPGPLEIRDVNSMYPDVMAHALHPIGTSAILDKRIRTNTCFVVAEGTNHGAFPTRRKDGSLSFTEEYGTFYTTIHEWNVAEQTKTFRTKRIIKTYGFDDRVTFDEFVYYFYNSRNVAKLSKDLIHDLFYKYILNSAYGKFAQNPENFADYSIRDRTSPALGEPWIPAYISNDFIIWKRDSEKKHYYNITTGASITGAARGKLLEGLSRADCPVYCDTDSIICRSMSGVDMDSSNLGAWKLEGVGSVGAFAGKKLYAIFDSYGHCIKKANKGAYLKPLEVYRIAEGEVIEAANPVPAFKLNGAHQFVSRRMRKTA